MLSASLHRLWNGSRAACPPLLSNALRSSSSALGQTTPASSASLVMLARSVFNAIRPYSRAAIRDLPEVDAAEHFASPFNTIWLPNAINPSFRPLEMLRAFSTHWTMAHQRKVADALRERLASLNLAGVEFMVPMAKYSGALIRFHSAEAMKEAVLKLSGERFALQALRALPVRGRPFVEDIVLEAPSTMMYLRMKAAELTKTEAFNLLRPYGRLLKLERNGDRWEALFATKTAAIAARTCLRGLVLDGFPTSLHTGFVPFRRFETFLNLLKNPKFAIPALSITMATSTWVLVDPFRTVTMMSRLSLPLGEKGASRPESDSVVAQYLEAPSIQSLTTSLKQLFSKRPERITVLAGAASSGKSQIIQSFFSRRPFCVRIDCSKESTVEGFVDRLSECVDFRPSFRTLNSITSWLYSMVPGKTDYKVSTTVEGAEVLRLLERTLAIISAKYPTTKRDEYDSYCVIVFDGLDQFLSRVRHDPAEYAQARFLLSEIFEWSKRNTERNHRAHVMFVVRSFSQLGRMLPAQTSPPLVVSVPDLSREETHIMIEERLRRRAQLRPEMRTALESEVEQVGHALDLVGGRLEHVHGLLYLVDGDHSLKEAERALLVKAEQDLLMRGFGERLFNSVSPGRWTQTQLWRLMQLLVTNEGTMNYDQARYSIFEGNEAGLVDLVAEDLLLCVPEGSDARGQSIDGTLQLSVSSPLQLTAMRSLLDKDEFALPMHNQWVKERVNEKKVELNLVEEELQRLLPGPSSSSHSSMKGVQSRVQELDQKVLSLNSAIQKLEASKKSL
mmetsp:Transcript_9503/g.29305  ORF Transcript_9503/g.29305 Transcript_9503/m.29305 type:complete len:789 (+) Transcript_9503:43-2409(+)